MLRWLLDSFTWLQPTKETSQTRTAKMVQDYFKSEGARINVYSRTYRAGSRVSLQIKPGDWESHEWEDGIDFKLAYNMQKEGFEWGAKCKNPSDPARISIRDTFIGGNEAGTPKLLRSAKKAGFILGQMRIDPSKPVSISIDYDMIEALDGEILEAYIIRFIDEQRTIRTAV